MPNFFGKTVFVANVADFLCSYRDNLIAELERCGCIVKTIESKCLSYANMFSVLEQSDMAIHFLDIEDEKREFGVDQILQLVEYSKGRICDQNSNKAPLEIYAWHPKLSNDLVEIEKILPSHISKAIQIEELELIHTTFEGFKKYLLNKIEDKPANHTDEILNKKVDQLQIYFMFDAMDKTRADEYIKALKIHGFLVDYPQFNSDIMKERSLHGAALKNFDVAIIFAENAGVNWINMKIMDILKSPGMGRNKPIKGKVIVAPEQIAGLLCPNKRGFDFISIGSESSQVHVDDILKRMNIFGQS